MNAGTGARRAALLLHAMQPADRQWLLAALPPQQGRALEDMLSELRALGIPPDRALLQPLAETRGPTAAERLARLAPLQRQWLAQRLQDEGPEFAGRLLAGQPWSGALLADCEEGFHRKAVAAMQPRPAASLQQAMFEAALQALAQCPAVPARHVRPWPWRLRA